MSIPQFKRNLRKLIQRNGMTVLELAEKSDTLHAQIYNYLNPKKYAETANIVFRLNGYVTVNGTIRHVALCFQ